MTQFACSAPTSTCTRPACLSPPLSLCLSLSWFPRPSVCLRHVVALGDAIISALQIAKFASPEKSISVFKASVLLLLQENTLYLCATSKLCTRYVEYHNMPTSCIHSFIRCRTWQQCRSHAPITDKHDDDELSRGMGWLG